MDTQYTNELTPEILAGMDISPFTAEQLTEMTAEARDLIEAQETFCRAHPVTAIYRLAVAGSQTERGGVADEFNADPEQGYKHRLSNGLWASVLTEGCTVTYPDGGTARIISSAGSQNTYDDRGIALVGSRLDNGDVIISTPQSSGMLVGREGVPMAEDFLISGQK
ncbi:hypothetical protein SJI19_08570 [Acerihabitans sp. TG2]|uniref:hypothetical protein n=1 Tax=Acerihabitans sp. TG2 TaxID=3096008 RepID=UPI002B22CBA7|nr:hypothetical protein [Acerihabitans sp. TG2]MEA9390593.1 hypothetical protein [Acerihabitans sp. TG2]